MTYTFAEKLFKQGTRYFIKIPFNVWEECGQKGLVPVKAFIEGCTFECRLVPKGEGTYYIPITKNVLNQIDNIQSLTYPKAGYCGQICIAMLTGLSVNEVVDVMQTKAWQCSFVKLLETLDYFGILHDDKITYTKGKGLILPECCIVNVKEGKPVF